MSQLVNPGNNIIICIFASNHCQMNRLFLLLFGMVSLVAHAQVPDYVPTDGLVAWYPFNGNANDESGNGHDGEINGATLTEDEYGNTNSAYYFDGNDRIDIAHHNDFDWSAMTFLIVYMDYDNPNAVPNGNSTLVTKQPGSGWGSGWGFSTGDENTEFGRCMTTTSGNECLGWGENEWGDWNMVAYTHSIDSVKVYFDSSLVSEEVAFGGFIANSLPITIGMRGNGWHQFIGSISLIGIWDRILTEEEILALYNAPAPAPGCTDSAACNYNDEANEDDGSCVYPPSESVDCEFGGNYCGEGTVWDSGLQTCVAFDDCPADLNGNGLVEVSDLLMVLADFGTECAPPVAEWTCGDPVSYHGYDYATIQIGEQCWFAENLRTELYSNGDTIPGNLSNEEWASTTEGAQAISIYGDALEMFGRAYNGYAVGDERGLCLSGWHVALDSEWKELEMELGMSEADANSGGWRGTDQGIQMKTTTGWSEGENGTNSSGFSAKPAGNRTSQGHWTNTVHNAFFWTPASSTGSASLFRHLRFEEAGVFRGNYGSGEGLSIRCLKD